MADRAIVDSARLDQRRAADTVSAAEPRLNDPSKSLVVAMVAAAVTALLYELSVADQRLWPCALLAPLPMLAMAPELRTGTAAQLAFVAYLIGNIAGWEGNNFAVPLLTMLSAHVAGAIVFATFVACAAEATRRWSGILAALVFPTFEVAFYYTLSGVSPHGTWGSPAYSQVDFPALLQTASWLGMCGVMFIMSLLPSGLAVAWYRRRWNMDWIQPAILAVGVFTLAVFFGWIRLLRTPSMPSMRVAMIASDQLIPQSESADVNDAADIVALYAKLVRKVAEEHPQVVVLPEKIVAVTPRYEWDVVQGFQRIASMSNVWLVVGINQIDRTPKRNIAIVISPDGKVAAAYAKHHLIPSLESDYKAGSKPVIFDTQWGRAAVLISQDLDFPETARELAEHDVRIVMAPASDWAGSEMIHQRMAVVRGVESGFSVARAARGGIVSANDSRGRELIARTSTRTEDALVTTDVPLGTGTTIYSRSGDWFGKLAVMFTILLMFRLAVSIWYAVRMRRVRTGNRVTPTGVISVDGGRAEVPGEEREERIYRTPTRRPE